MRCTAGWTAVTLLAGAVSVGAMGKQPVPALVPGIGPGGAAPTPPVAEKADPAVAQLIKNLGDDDYRVREKAGRDLVALGEKALPQMRVALRETDSPEVQRRLAVMVRKIDTERLTTPKRVTFAKKMTVKAALEEITKQTGYKVEFSGSDNQSHAFDFDNAPFWTAIDKVAGAAGCVVYAEYDDSVIRVYNQDAMNPHVAYAGPFRFLATNIHSNRSVQLSGIPRRGNGQNRYEHMNLSFQIQSEPKNPMLGVTGVEVVSAVDELGGSLVVPKNQNDRSYYYQNNSFRGHNTYASLNLARADKSATTIKSLKGRAGIILLAGTRPEIVIPDPLKVKKQTFTGRTAEIEFGSLVEDATTKGQYTLDLTARKVGDIDPDRPDYNWSNVFWHKIELTDAAGNRYHAHGPNNFNNNGTSAQMSIMFGSQDRRGNAPAKLGPPVKLVVNEWLSITHEVTFEFKDVPLP